MTLLARDTGHYDFTLDLAVAKTTEQEISELLHRYYGMITKEFSNHKRYDLLVLSKKNPLGVTIEVKEDFQCGRTNNMALEFSSWNRPAGITTTGADFYIHKFHMSNGVEYWSTPTSELKKLVANKKYHRIVNGGDKGSNSMNYLITLDVFKGVSKELFT